MTRLRASCLLAAMVLCAWPAAAPAQTPDPCTYDACALRVRYRLFGGQIVRGREDDRVASLGWLAPSVPLFAERSDTAAWYYASFRRRQHVGAALGFAGLVASAAALLVRDSNDDLAAGLGIGGSVLFIGGGIQLGRANERLSRAVWWYNRALEPTAAAPAAGR